MPRETRAIIGLAGPLAGGELGTIGMVCTDSTLVGRLGAEPLAALGFAIAYQFVVLALLVGTLSAVTPLVSRAHGARDDATARQLSLASLWLGAVLAVPAIGAFLVGGLVARLSGQPAAVISGAATYFHWLALGAPAFLVFSAARASLDGTGRTRPGMTVTLGALIVNAVVGVWLIPRYGITGAAIATTVVRWLMLAAIVVPFRRATAVARHAQRRVPSLLAVSARIVTVGAPIGVQWSIEMGVFAVAATFAGHLGLAALAAWQIAFNVVQAAFSVACAIAAAGAIRFGRALGACQPHTAWEVVRSTYGLTLAISLTCGLTLTLANHTLARLYTSDASVLAAAAPCFIAAGLFTIGDQLQTCALTLLHGATDTIAAAVISFGGCWAIGLPLAWYLSTHGPAGPIGIWIGLGAGVAAAAFTAALRLRHTLAHAMHALKAVAVAGKVAASPARALA